MCGLALSRTSPRAWRVWLGLCLWGAAACLSVDTWAQDIPV